MVERVCTPTVYQKKYCSCGPHQRVFEAQVVPKIPPNSPSLDARHEKKNDDWHGGDTREKSERKQRATDQLCRRNRRSPELAGSIAGAVELIGQHREIADRQSRVRKEPE